MSRDGQRPSRREFLQHSAGAAGLTSLMSVHSLLGMGPYVSEQWNRTFERSPSQDSNGMVRTQDGNFVVASFTEVGGLGVWLVKFRPDGTKLWERKIGAVDGVATEVPWDIAEAGDGSLYVATDGDGWNVVKTTPEGEPVWIREWLPQWDDVVDWDSPLQIGGTDKGGCVVAGGIGRGSDRNDYDSMVAVTNYASGGDLKSQKAADIEHSDVQVLDITIADGVYVASTPEDHFRVDRFTDGEIENQLNANLLDDNQGLRYTGGIYTDAARLSDGGYVVSVAGAGGTRFSPNGRVVWNTIIDLGNRQNNTRGKSVTIGRNGRIATVGKLRDSATRPGWIVVMDLADGSVETVHRFQDTDGGDAYRKAQHVVPTEDGFAVSGLQGRDWGTNTSLWVGSVDIEQDNTPDLLQTVLGVGAVGAGGWAVKRWRADEKGEDDGSSSGWHDRIS
ncbi:hypothetical protein [Haloarchaeobius iranensis]|uniref:hypothetical protein n=1 Tax=Haloarchaeobius iranensis TaxID=996166 RepID=UPI00360ED22F